MFRTLQSWKAGDAPALQALIKRNIQIKSEVSAETNVTRLGGRTLLSFGRALGHAIERAGNYRKFLRRWGSGEPWDCSRLCNLDEKGWAGGRISATQLLIFFGDSDPPLTVPSSLSAQKIFDAIKFDKKFEGGKVRFVVTPRIGSTPAADERDSA